MSDKIARQYSPTELDAAVEEYWKKVDAYEQTVAAHDDDPSFYFLDGPPYVSGQTHLGNGWNKVLKDFTIRYLRMQGYNVTDRPGYDMHGLPIETKVEEELGFDTKQDIESYGTETFLEKCEDYAQRHRERLESDFQSLGVWMDWENRYQTNTTEYIEAAWWALNRIHENDLVERDDRITNWCPRCQTALADAEVEFEDITSPAIYVTFPLVDSDASLIVWTTTPWTIPANLYVAVDGDLAYSRVRARRGDAIQELIVASECVEDVLSAGRYEAYETLETMRGEDLVGLAYEHPLADELPRQQELDEKETVHRVYATDFVTAEKTGLVHAAPGHGEEDYAFGQRYDLPTYTPVSETGEYSAEAGAYKGLEISLGDEEGSANHAVVAALDERSSLVASGTEQHRYGHCWRCDTPIVLMATDQWFIRITDVHDRLLEEMAKSKWYPQWARDKRFRNWVENARDWCFSRQRYWGIPLPIWTAENDPNDAIVVESVSELTTRVDQDIDPETIDLHRSTVDDLTITENDTTYTRVRDIFDVWFESGVAHLASLGFPNDTDTFEQLWPADLIIEAHDQTRGWFWSQLEVGVAAFDHVPYETVVMHGFLNDTDSEKMSKSVGNIIEPKTARERYGVGSTRLYLLSHDQLGDDFDFNWDSIEQQLRRLNIVWNTHRFAAQYMRYDDFDAPDASPDSVNLEPLDEWVLSRLQSTKRSVTDDIEEFEIHHALGTLMGFLIDDVSRYYVQTVRSRIWEESDSPSKKAAYTTLTTVFDEALRLLAPFTPIISERMYQNVVGNADTIHALDWPTVDEQYLDEGLEGNISTVRAIEEAASKARQRADRSLRWPVRDVVVSADERTVANTVELFSGLLKERLNAKAVSVTHGEWDRVTFEADPRMEVLGPAFSEQADTVADELSALTRVDLETTDTLTVSGERIDVTDDMMDFSRSPPESYVEGEFDGGRVYLDLTLTDGVEAEGFANEIVRRIQDMRQDLDLEFDERIDVALEIDDDRIESLVDNRLPSIAEETRAAEFVESVDDGVADEWEIEHVNVRIAVSSRVFS